MSSMFLYLHVTESYIYINLYVFQGVRDLLKTVLDKIQTIPTIVSSAIFQQLLAAREVPGLPVFYYLIYLL